MWLPLLYRMYIYNLILSLKEMKTFAFAVKEKQFTNIYRVKGLHEAMRSEE